MIKRSLIFTYTIAFALALQAASWDKEQQKQYEDADIYFEIGDYWNALDRFLQLYAVDSNHVDLNFKLGVCYFNLRKADVSLPFFQKANRAGNMESSYFLGQIEHLNEDFDAAIKHYQVYLNFDQKSSASIEEVNRLLERSKYAKRLMQNPSNVEIINAGASINTAYHEYAPLTYGIEDELYFTSRRPGSTGGNLDPFGRPFEDIYVSRKENGFWSQPKILQGSINTPTNDASVGISPDGQTLYLFRTNEDLISGDLYQSIQDENGWQVPEKLSSKINSNYVESSASLTNDERTLYFSSNREGGYGGKDIYRVVKLPTGQWSAAMNLGPTINTPGDEDAPYIHADSKTLYFSSNGHKTMGGYDIFSTELSEEGLWSEPLNMGYPVNTVSNDLYFVMSSDKQNGYYSSSQPGGFGGQDIYVINFKLFAQVLSVVKGKVFEDGATIPVGAQITLIDSETRNIQGIYKTNDESGKFIMVIVPEKEYTMLVEAEGYHTYSKQVRFEGVGLLAKGIKEINLTPKEVATNE